MYIIFPKADEQIPSCDLIDIEGKVYWQKQHNIDSVSNKSLNSVRTPASEDTYFLRALLDINTSSEPYFMSRSDHFMAWLLKGINSHVVIHCSIHRYEEFLYEACFIGEKVIEARRLYAGFKSDELADNLAAEVRQFQQRYRINVKPEIEQIIDDFRQGSM